jgi:hypothetical protein
MSGRRSLMREISRGELHFNFLFGRRLRWCADKLTIRVICFSPLLFCQAYLCLFFVVFLLYLGPINF